MVVDLKFIFKQYYGISLSVFCNFFHTLSRNFKLLARGLKGIFLHIVHFLNAAWAVALLRALDLEQYNSVFESSTSSRTD